MNGKKVDNESHRIVMGLIFIAVVSMIAGAFITHVIYEEKFKAIESELESFKCYRDAFNNLYLEKVNVNVKQWILIEFIKFYFEGHGYGNITCVTYIRPENMENVEGIYGLIVKGEKGFVVFVYYFDGEEIYDRTLILESDL